MPIITFDRFEQGIDRRKSRNIADANRLHDLKNAYVTNGWAVKRRPGTVFADAQSAVTSQGMFAYQGVIYSFSTFYNQNIRLQNPNQPDEIEHIALDVPNTGSEVVVGLNFADIFNGNIYCVVEFSNGVFTHYSGPPITGGSGEAYFTLTEVTQAPNTSAAIKINSKIYAIDGDIVRYSATDNSSDWTTANDAGFLPTGLRASGSPIARALAEYDGQLVVFMEDHIQIWTVDADPANNGIVRIIRNVGTRYPKTIAPVSRDLFFLSDAGFRSIARQSSTENIDDLDVGSPIDPIIQNTTIDSPIAAYYPDLGQYLCAIGSEIFAFSYSETSKVSAWSRYEYGYDIKDMVAVGADMYISDGASIYKFKPDLGTDRVPFLGDVPIDVDFEMAFQHFKKPSVLKYMSAFDLVCEGDAIVQHRYQSNQENLITDPITLSGDTRPGGKIPVEVVATSVATRISGTAVSQIDSFSYEWRERGNL